VIEVWRYRYGGVTSGLVGFAVEACDTKAGKVAHVDENGRFLVVKTGSFLSNHRRVVPAGAIRRIDHASRAVRLAVTKGVVDDAPEFDERADLDPGLARSVEIHFGRHAPHPAS
jgi:hypothetical protein